MTLVQERDTHGGGAEEMSGRPSVVERVTQILGVFLLGHERLMLEDVTVMTRLPRSTAFRIMSQLVDLGWLEHDSRGYRLGAQVEGIGARGRDHGELRAAAAGVLNRLHLATGAVVHLGVLEGGQLHYLDKLGGPVLDSIPSTVDTRVPADTTPMGRAMLATLAPEHVDALVAATAEHPRRAALDIADLHLRLNAARRRGGVDVVRRGGTRGLIVAVGVPVPGPDGLLASIGVSCGDGRLIPETVGPLALSAARRLTLQLGGRPDPRPGRRGHSRSRSNAPARAAVR